MRIHRQVPRVALLAGTGFTIAARGAVAGNGGATLFIPGGGCGVSDSEPVTVIRVVSGADEGALDDAGNGCAGTWTPVISPERPRTGSTLSAAPREAGGGSGDV